MRFLHHKVCLKGPFPDVDDMHAEELEAFDLLHRGSLSLLSPVVHDQLLRFVDIDGEVIFLAPLHQGTHLLPVSCLVSAGNQAYYCVLLLCQQQT